MVDGWGGCISLRLLLFLSFVLEVVFSSVSVQHLYPEKGWGK